LISHNLWPISKVFFAIFGYIAKNTLPNRDRQSLLYFTLSGQFQSTLSDIFQIKALGNYYGSEDMSEFGTRLEQNSLKTVLEQSRANDFRKFADPCYPLVPISQFLAPN
jgi:hypothetical protein